MSIDDIRKKEFEHNLKKSQTLKEDLAERYAAKLEINRQRDKEREEQRVRENKLKKKMKRKEGELVKHNKKLGNAPIAMLGNGDMSPDGDIEND